MTDIPSAPALTQVLATHWSVAQQGTLPSLVTAEVKRRVLDTLAAGIAGVGTPEVVATTKAVAALGGRSHPADGAVLWGHQARTTPALAALSNGTAAHARELDDFDGCGHTGAVVVPAVCAVADQIGADGKTVIAAVAAGYDVAGRMLDAAGGYRPHNGRGWHSTATCGTFGAAAGAARALGLDASQFAHALGIAGTYVGGVWAFMADGAMTKRLHPGKAAETGVTAAFLAQAGMTGPAQILEAPWGGFFPTYCGDTARPERLLAGLGTHNAIMATGIKPYACCRGSHSSIDALLQLIGQHGLQAAQIAAIVVHCPEHTARLVGSHRVDSVLDAQMSLPYALAVTACGGRADLPQFDPLRTDEPEVRRLMAATCLEADRPATDMEGPEVEVLLTDGRTLRAQVPYAKGHPTNPLSDREVHAKAESLIVPALGASRFEQIAQAIRQLESLTDMRELTALLRPA